MQRRSTALVPPCTNGAISIRRTRVRAASSAIPVGKGSKMELNFGISALPVPLDRHIPYSVASPQAQIVSDAMLFVECW